MSYTKQQFRQGDILRAAQLNAMDAQIEELSNRINNNENNTSEDYLTADSLKTINGESLVGSGNIVINGGAGTVGPQGPQGEQGPKGDDGADGVSVTSVKQTTTSSADGGTNVVTVTLSNGTTSTFNIKNGSKGSTGSKGDTGATGANGSNGVTFTPSVDSAGNLSWTNNGGLTNPSTINIKGPKGDSGSVGGKEIVEIAVVDGSIVFMGNESRPAFEPGKIYYATTPVLEVVSIQSVIPPTGDIGEYSLHFSYRNPSIAGFEAPSDWLWANGIPTIEAGVSYELSVVATKSGNDFIYKAVLTKFKPVE